MAMLAVRVTPRASKPGIGGWRDGPDGRRELEVRVSAPPADGAANAAVVEALADALGVPRRAVRIVAGATSRHKRAEVDLPAVELDRRLPLAR